MKNVLSALYDSMLIFVLLFIVVASFVATFALSPIPYRESLLAQNENTPILGEEDRPTLRFENIYEEHDFFKVNSTQDARTYTATILIGPMSEGEVDKALVEIFNDSELTREADIQVKVPESDTNGITIKLSTNGSTIDANSDQTIEISPKSSRKVNFYLESQDRINFPIEISINITLR